SDVFDVPASAMTPTQPATASTSPFPRLAGRRLAVLGIRLLGFPMARRRCQAGCAVSACNRTRAQGDARATRGARIADTPADAVRDADWVLLMLQDGATVEDVLFHQGVADALRQGSLVIDMSSIQPRQAREHAARLEALGLRLLDAPVSGGTVGAE